MAGEPRGEEHREAGLIVEHYRLDASTSMRRALGLASLVVTAGALLMASAIVVSRHDGGARATPVRDALFRAGEVTAEGAPVERPPGLELALGVAGLACIALGGASAIVGLRRVLTDESYLALCTRGAYFRAGAERALVFWEDVEAVRWDAEERAVRFERHDGSAWIRAERYAGIDGPSLAKRAAEVRRKALFGLLPGSRFSARGSRPPSPPRAGA